MIVYVDSSVLVRAYLQDEPDHDDARYLIEDPDYLVLTGTWTPIEVSGALVRAGRAGRGNEDELLSLLDQDIGPDGSVVVVTANQDRIEERTMSIVRTHGLRAMDAWQVAAAEELMAGLAEGGEDRCFASRDRRQAEVAEAVGFRVI